MVRIQQSPRLSGIISALLLFLNQTALAYDLDVNSKDSVFKTAKDMAADLVSFYHGDDPGGTPGLLPEPYYWWEAGAMFGALIEYWAYTKDTTYNNMVIEGLLNQVGDNNDYMPGTQTLTEGNDDQGFWGLAVMSAAEFGFPNPAPDRPQWLALAQAVFNTQAPRWETSTCNGGLRWQIFKWNKGYDYKNSISQGCFFALGARLALYTQNKTYSDWAEKTWDWMNSTKLIDEKTWAVYDGATMGTNCTQITKYQFSYNAGVFILGAAAMYKHTGEQRWKDRLDSLLKGAGVFFKNDIMVEVACETVDRCNTDQKSFKAYLSRWMGAVTSWAPDTLDVVLPLLQTSAKAAAKLCTGGNNGRMCGLVWTGQKYDGKSGVGPQMAALEVTLNTMAKFRPKPFTERNGGTSKGDASAGSSDIGRDQPKTYGPLSPGNHAAGAILTILVLVAWLAMLTFMLVDETDKRNAFQQFRAALTGAKAKGSALGAVVLGRQPSTESVTEKGGAQPSSISDRSSRISAVDPDAIEQIPVSIGHVRSHSDNTPRRASNMPLGWPRNSIARQSSASQSDSEQGKPNESTLRHSTLASEIGRAE